jgi:hypothetical protein
MRQNPFLRKRSLPKMALLSAGGREQSFKEERILTKDDN